MFSLDSVPTVVDGVFIAYILRGKEHIFFGGGAAPNPHANVFDFYTRDA